MSSKSRFVQCGLELNTKHPSPPTPNPHLVDQPLPKVRVAFHPLDGFHKHPSVSELSSTDTTASLPSSLAVRGQTATELRDLTARLRPSKAGVGSVGGVWRTKGSPHSVMFERRTKGAEIVEKATIACASPPPSSPL